MIEVKRTGFVWQFPAVVERVLDGDSIECNILFRADEEHTNVNVRVEGINAIELSQAFGNESKLALEAMIPAGTALTLLHRKPEKYGRFLARPIRLSDGLDVSQAMLLKKASDGITQLAVPYSG